MLVTESMTVVRAIVAVLKMVMLKAMERGIMSKAAGRTCCLTELNYWQHAAPEESTHITRQFIW